MRLRATVAIVFGAAAAGYAAGRLRQPDPPQAVAVIATSSFEAASVPADCQSAKTQLAICMAYRPKADAAGRDERDKYLAMCRSDLEACRNKPALPACWEFIDLAPVYDRELGEPEPSPETLERAKHPSAEQCAEVLTWAQRASSQHKTCLKGEPPAGFREKYGRPPSERALVKACQRPDAINAWLEREDARVRATGHEPTFRVRAGPDGGVLFAYPGDELRPMAPAESSP